MNSTVKEVIKIRDGKPVYTLLVVQEQKNDDKVKMAIYIKQGDIYFESSGYGWNDNATFDINDEAHSIAKEMFISSLKVSIKNRILELKQLESILENLGLKEVLKDTIQDNVKLLITPVNSENKKDDLDEPPFVGRTDYCE